MRENLSYKLRNPEVSCVFNPRSVGSCNLVLYEKDIPEMYQNFDSIPGVADRDLARAGSSVILADYCPYVQVYILHREKRVTSFPSPAGMSLTKLPLGRNNSVMTSLFPPRESLVVTSRLGTGNSRTFFTVYTVHCKKD